MFDIFSCHSHLAPGVCVCPGLADAGRSGHSATQAFLILVVEFLTYIIMKSVIKTILRVFIAGDLYDTIYKRGTDPGHPE